MLERSHLPGTDVDHDELTSALAAARNRLRRMGARPGSRTLDLDDLVQETAATAYGGGIAIRKQLFLAIAANKARDLMRSRGRAPIEDLGEASLDDFEARPNGRRAQRSILEAWSEVCGRTLRLGGLPRRVLAMRHGLDLDWETIAFVEQRQPEAARSLYYRGRDSIRPRRCPARAAASGEA
jgi:DNA-directed RNA polymerase specialized sigma24 family protein